MPGLTGWAKDAGKSVNKVMVYPSMAATYGYQGKAGFKVTVDRAGHVVSFDQTVKADSPLINGAARRVVNRADFPALPASYGKDTMTFALNLQYTIADGPEQARALKREGRVTGEAVAANSAPMVASIQILDNQD